MEHRSGRDGGAKRGPGPGERTGVVVALRPRPRVPATMSFGEAWYHQAAVEEAAKGAPPIR